MEHGVITAIYKKHEEILATIEEYNIFEKEIFLTESMFGPAIEAIDKAKERTHFFEVVDGEIYFVLMESVLFCIYSPILGDKSKPREERISSLRCISLEELLQLAPKEKCKKYMYHLDFFEENLSVFTI